MSVLASPSEIDRLVYHMPTVARFTDGDWARGFARSIIRQSKHRDWQPSAKQLTIMRELVSDLFRRDGNAEGDIEVVE